MSVSFCLPHPVAVSAFMICRGLCACTEMFWMCVLYVSFRPKVSPRTFGCIAMGSALLCIFKSNLMIVSGMFVCSSLLISVYMFIVSKAHIECYSDCSRRGSHLVEPLCYGVM